MKQLINIPGAVWVTLIVAITKWLSDSFPDQPWLPAIVVVLGAVAKLIQMYLPGQPATVTAAEPGTPTPTASVAPDGDDYTWAATQSTAEPARGFTAFLLG